MEFLSKVFYCSVSVKILAGEDIDVDVVLLNKRMNADMAFRYENKS